MFHVVFRILLLVIYMKALEDSVWVETYFFLLSVIDFLLLVIKYVVSVRRGFLFLLVLGICCVILLGHFLSLP